VEHSVFFDTTVVTLQQRISVYEHMLGSLERFGFAHGPDFEQVSVGYKKLINRQKGWFHWYVLDTFYDLWWNYGYSQWRVVLVWTPLFWLLFSVISAFLYQRLNQQVYRIKFLDKVDRKSRLVWRFYVALVYTAILFFGLKMDTNKFQDGALSHSPFLLAYLLLVYAVGLVCLGYIVNIVITKAV